MRKIDVIENKMFDNIQEIKRLEQANKDLIAPLINAYLDEKGLVKGKTIVTKDGEDYLVDGIYCNENGVAFKGDWLTGYKIKKDGNPGSQLKTIYNGWKIVE